MSPSFDRTIDFLAEEAGGLTATALRRGGVLAEFFVEDTLVQHLTLRYRRGKPREIGTTQRIAGVGVRVLDGSTSWYISTPDLSVASIRKAASDVNSTVDSSATAPGVIEAASLQRYDGLPQDAPSENSAGEVRALLEQAADAAHGLFPDLRDLEVGFQGSARRIAVASSDGRLTTTSRSMVGLRVRLRRGVHTSYAVGGGVGGLGLFLEAVPESIAAEAARRLQYASGAGTGTLPVGSEMPVVLAGGWGGVWLHEVVGHLLEADVAVDCSVPGAFAAERIGRRVANECISVFDDATLDAGRGTTRVDDEGTPARRNTLIEGGILAALLTDRAMASRLGLPESGSGRRQDYRNQPLPRMSNLLLATGDADPESLVHEADTGLFVTMIGNGAVAPADDSFSFDVLEGYAIESGRIGSPVRGLRLSGRPSEMLTRIRGVANDFQLDAGRGFCSKNGQVVPVSVGMPTVLIDKMTVNSLS